MARSELDEIEAKSPAMTAEEKVPAVTWDAEAERRLRWKCDRHVLPCITLLFFLSFLDRTNIGGYSYCVFTAVCA